MIMIKDCSDVNIKGMDDKRQVTELFIHRADYVLLPTIEYGDNSKISQEQNHLGRSSRFEGCGNVWGAPDSPTGKSADQVNNTKWQGKVILTAKSETGTSEKVMMPHVTDEGKSNKPSVKGTLTAQLHQEMTQRMTLTCWTPPTVSRFCWMYRKELT